MKYRLLQRKEKDTQTQSEYWFSIAIAVQREGGISLRQWGRIPFLTKKKRLEALNLLDVPKSQRQYPVRWTEIRELKEESPLWMLETMKQAEPVECENETTVSLTPLSTPVDNPSAAVPTPETAGQTPKSIETAPHTA